MLSKISVQPNFIKSLLFIALAGISFSAAAEHHGDAAHKAKKAVDVKMKTSPKDKKAAMKAALTDEEKAVEEVAEKAAEKKDVEKAVDVEDAENMQELNPDG